MMTENDLLIIENFLNLRNAIIMQAIDDYKYLCTKRKTIDRGISMAEIERFFEKDCNGLLNDTDISGEDILKRLYIIKNAPKRNKRIDK